MDFGAVICKPYPECKTCFFNQHCEAYLKSKQDLLPVKQKKLKIKERWLNYFVVRCKDQVLIRQRTSKDIWQQLFEFVLIETDRYCPEKKLLSLLKKQYGISFYNHHSSYTAKQKLSHQLINFSFQQIELKQKTGIPEFSWVKITDLKQYAFPKSLQELVATALA